MTLLAVFNTMGTPTLTDDPDSYLSGSVYGNRGDLQDEFTETYMLPGEILGQGAYGDHYFQLTSFEGVSNGVDESASLASVYHCILPVPQNLQTAYNGNYGGYHETGMNRLIRQAPQILGAAGSAAMGGLKSGWADFGNGQTNDPFRGVERAAVAAWNSLAKSAQSTGALDALKVEGSGLLGDSFKNSYLRGMNKAWRNTEVMTFEGMSIRDWTFQWKIIPKNRDELKVLYQMKEKLVLTMHPTIVDDFFISYPNYFAFVIRSASESEADPPSRMLPKSGPCFLTNVSLNYNGSGNPVFFKDAEFREPVEYDLSISLRETRAYSRENYETGMSSKVAGANAGGSYAESNEAAEKMVGKPR